MKWPWVLRKTYDRHLKAAYASRDAARAAYAEVCAKLGPPTYHGIPLEYDHSLDAPPGTVLRYRDGLGWHTVPVDACADEDRSGGAW